ncbi:MAG: hypothetical protein CM15mP107_1420 [Bacteroidota bacterium]|nr:MAG: hypothetical protein CM15mP107_1420 [Bacteroidota bacterium]
MSYKDELLDNSGELSTKYLQKLNYHKQDYLNTEYLGILMDDNQENEALKDVRVRQALNLAFDRDLMMQYLRNNIGTPAHNGFIPKVYQVTNQGRDITIIRNWQKNSY